MKMSEFTENSSISKLLEVSIINGSYFRNTTVYLKLLSEALFLNILQIGSYLP